MAPADRDGGPQAEGRGEGTRRQHAEASLEAPDRRAARAVARPRRRRALARRRAPPRGGARRTSRRMPRRSSAARTARTARVVAAILARHAHAAVQRRADRRRAQHVNRDDAVLAHEGDARGEAVAASTSALVRPPAPSSSWRRALAATSTGSSLTGRSTATSARGPSVARASGVAARADAAASHAASARDERAARAHGKPRIARACSRYVPSGKRSRYARATGAAAARPSSRSTSSISRPNASAA